MYIFLKINTRNKIKISKWKEKNYKKKMNTKIFKKNIHRRQKNLKFTITTNLLEKIKLFIYYGKQSSAEN